MNRHARRHKPADTLHRRAWKPRGYWVCARFLMPADFLPFPAGLKPAPGKGLRPPDFFHVLRRVATSAGYNVTPYMTTRITTIVERLCMQNDYLGEFITNLAADASAAIEAAAQAQCAEQAAQHTKWRERLTPLDQRLAKLLAEIPDAIKVGGLPLEALRGQLAGRYSQTARAADVAAALRKLGWTRTRCWRGDESPEGFRARWLPPCK